MFYSNCGSKEWKYKYKYIYFVREVCFGLFVFLNLGFTICDTRGNWEKICQQYGVYDNFLRNTESSNI